MQLFLLTSLTMIAFAANSVLNRLAVDSAAADPGGFAVIRVLAGAAMLVVLTTATGRTLPLRSRARLIGALALSVYMVGFSAAYLAVGAGVGALILFGVVQITMFAAVWLAGPPPTAAQIAGAAVAVAGLGWVLWPAGPVQVPPGGAALMAAAGIGWAFYTLSGRSETDPLAATAANFVIALPVTALATLLLAGGWHMDARGVALAAVSGALTSGMGYALWYRLLPSLAAPVAATVQLSVPVIAIAMGVVLLAETAPPRLIAGAALVLGGIALTTLRRNPG